jgi:hypothetical protein
MKSYMLTHYYPRCTMHKTIFDVTRAHNQAWADQIGFEFISDERRRLPSEYIYREKSAFITECLEKMEDGDEVLWLDGDAIVWRDPTGIFDALVGADIGMVKFVNERWNSGVCAFPVNKTTRALWKEIITHEHGYKQPFNDGPMDDNVCEKWDAHECKACPWPAEKRGPLCGSHKTKVKELDRRWNEHWDARDENTKIIGFHMRVETAVIDLLKLAMQEAPRG